MKKLNYIIDINDEELLNAKIELNTTAGGPGKQQFIDRWLCLSKKRKNAGDCYGSHCAFYTGDINKNFHRNDIVFSFVRIYDDLYLLTTVGKVKEDKLQRFSSFVIIDRYKKYFGKLIIKKPKNLGQRYTFYLKNQINKIFIKTILDDLYNGEIKNFNSIKSKYNSLYKINEKYTKIKKHNKQQEFLFKLSKENRIELAKNSGNDRPLKKISICESF